MKYLFYSLIAFFDISICAQEKSTQRIIQLNAQFRQRLGSIVSANPNLKREIIYRHARNLQAQLESTVAKGVDKNTPEIKKLHKQLLDESKYTPISQGLLGATAATAITTYAAIALRPKARQARAELRQELDIVLKGLLIYRSAEPGYYRGWSNALKEIVEEAAKISHVEDDKSDISGPQLAGYRRTVKRYGFAKIKKGVSGGCHDRLSSVVKYVAEANHTLYRTHLLAAASSGTALLLGAGGYVLFDMNAPSIDDARADWESNHFSEPKKREVIEASREYQALAKLYAADVAKSILQLTLEGKDFEQVITQSFGQQRVEKERLLKQFKSMEELLDGNFSTIKNLEEKYGPIITQSIEDLLVWGLMDKRQIITHFGDILPGLASAFATVK